MSSPVSPELRRYRYRIFALTWLVYAGFYLCRKNLSVAMPYIEEELGYSMVQLGWCISGYSALYALGQFANGLLSDRFGPRLIVGIGLIISVLSNVAMGFGAALIIFAVLHLFNGYGQSTGWSGMITNMSTWYERRERGVVMAWWATCYSIGGLIATLFAAYMAADFPFFASLGWRRAFWAPAILLGLITLAYILFTRNKPSDAGFEEFDEEDLSLSAAGLADATSTRAAWGAVLANPAVWITGAMYFFLKLTRYAFLYWLPLYFVKELAYEKGAAGYVSSVYEMAGFAGVVAAGYASDKLMGSRRFPVACIMLLCLAGACYLYPQVAPVGWFANVAGLALIGFMTFGPDSLMTGAAAMDMGGPKASGLAAGFINGMGSVGQIFSPLIVAYVADSEYGWNGVFYLFVIMSLIGAALMATKWNYGARTKDAAA